MACVLFTDLVDSTALMATLGEHVFDQLRNAHFACLRKTLATHGGTEVKNTATGSWPRSQRVHLRPHGRGAATSRPPQ
jgi:class 3 adenylate cyclase